MLAYLYCRYRERGLATPTRATATNMTKLTDHKFELLWMIIESVPKDEILLVRISYKSNIILIKEDGLRMPTDIDLREILVRTWYSQQHA